MKRVSSINRVKNMASKKFFSINLVHFNFHYEDEPCIHRESVAIFRQYDNFPHEVWMTLMI